MNLIEINKRYSELATSDCCLSCGGAIDYATPQPGEVCVDLGSGRGTDVLRMAEKVGENGMAIGVDISDGMIKKAQENAERFKVSNVLFVQSELEKIDLPDETADLVISNCTINHAHDKQTVWNEIFRILKKGGRFAISDIYSSMPVPEEFRNDPVAVAECWAGAITKNEYLSQLENAGFKSINILEESAPYPKGKIKVSSWTIAAIKPSVNCCG
jgi:arsenite methyltransferase